MNRIPFGQETKLEILTTICPGCEAQRGAYHEHGCPVETCPECGGRVLLIELDPSNNLLAILEKRS